MGGGGSQRGYSMVRWLAGRCRRGEADECAVALVVMGGRDREVSGGREEGGRRGERGREEGGSASEGETVARLAAHGGSSFSSSLLSLHIYSLPATNYRTTPQPRPAHPSHVRCLAHAAPTLARLQSPGTSCPPSLPRTVCIFLPLCTLFVGERLRLFTHALCIIPAPLQRAVAA